MRRPCRGTKGVRDSLHYFAWPLPDDVHYSFYLDGTVYDPFPDVEVGIVDTTDQYAFGGDTPPLPPPFGPSTDTQMTADLDYALVSYYGFGQDDVFRDDFNSSGFTNWNLNPPTHPGNLQESSGMARLNYLASSSPTVNTGGNIYRTGVPVPYQEAYFTYAVKVFSAGSACQVPLNAIDGFTAQISLTPTTATWINLAAFPSSSTVTGLTLDDGNWHIVGMRRHAIAFPAAPPVVVPASPLTGVFVTSDADSESGWTLHTDVGG